MAPNPFEECEKNIQGVPPGTSSCFKLLNPSLDEVNQHCSIDILPILLDGVSFPERLNCPLHSSHGEDVYSISVLSAEGNSPQCSSQLAVLSFLEVANRPKNQMCLDAQLNCPDCIDLQMKSADGAPPCIVDVNVEKEYLKTPESNDEAVESLKSEGVLTDCQMTFLRHNKNLFDKK
ncbi:hypothetical protein CJ030_MR6G013357 [Morella rubra]|uniref:Uncharacterized protein n=1 Tax=Morella rubra TaxID=262757 RepID=A0A6A1VEG3_9ROSI|nr:hypothetical protein CJ030_MR6G013357 [Morella rubra]